MYSYRAYDLRIDSDFELPELVESSEGDPDLTIKLGEVAPQEHAIDYEGIFRYQISSAEAYFFWDDVASFRARNGNEVIIEPRPGVEEELVRLLLLGAVFSVLLSQRGLLVLHASAVAINGCAIVFMAGKGWGKSTIAATLQARGHYLLADDLVALKFNGGGSPVVLPGFPQIKLWPEAVTSLGEDPEKLPRVASKYEKRARRSTERFSQELFPLKVLYVIAAGDTPKSIPIQPHEAINQIIANSHIARFGKQALSGIEASTHLRQCVDLARSVPVCYLNRPVGLMMLPAAAKLVEECAGFEIEQPEIESLSLLPSA